MRKFTTCVAMLALACWAACDGGMSAAEVEQLVEAKVTAVGGGGGGGAAPGGAAVERDSQTPPTAQTKKKAKKKASGPKLEDLAGLSDDGVAKAEATISAFAALRDLMSGYSPKLPQIKDTNILQCTTKKSREDDAELSKLWKSFERERRDTKKERRRLKREFAKRIEPPNYHLDYDWQSRMGFTRVDIYGCWDSDDYEWTNYSRGDCTSSYEHWKFRSVRYNESDSIYLYSNSETAQPTELMKRMEAEGSEAVERAYCVVDDYDSKRVKGQDEPDHWVECMGHDFRILLSAATLDVGRGDLISVPVANVKRPGGGVLRRKSVGSSWRQEWFWYVDADVATATVEERNQSCPEQAAISKEICHRTDRRSDPRSVVTHCSTAGETKKLMENTKKWDRKSIKKKDEVMLEALAYLAEKSADDPWVHYTRGNYLMKGKKKAEAAASYEKAHAVAKDPKTQLLIAERAKQAGRPDLYTACVKKACELGMQAACGLVAQ